VARPQAAQPNYRGDLVTVDKMAGMWSHAGKKKVSKPKGK